MKKQLYMKGCFFMFKGNYIAKILPENLSCYFTGTLEEIRIRKNKPVIFAYSDMEKISDKIFYREDMEDFLERVTASSVYAYTDDIKNGFITVIGGHRIGLCGTAVYENEKITAIKDITDINIRIAKELKGIGEGVYSKIATKNDIGNTLIISPPGMGKTTLLRDITRLVSDNLEKSKISLVDERNEISATFMGNAQNDVGLRTDVFCGYTKKDALIRAMRSMSPTVAVLDEIGGDDDSDAILKCAYSGIRVIATVHGNGLSDAKEKLKVLFENKIFDYAVLLGKKDKYERTCEIMGL